MSTAPASRSVDARSRENIAGVLAGVAADIDAVAGRTVVAAERLAAEGAEPNLVVAARRAAQALADAAAALRRDGLLSGDQQQLL